MLELLTNTFHTILYRPLFNFLILLYNYLPLNDLGVIIIILTLIIYLILYPISVKAVKSQKVLAELRPKILEIQKRYKGDKEKQTIEIMRCYKEAKINPLGGCLPLLFQLPVLIALFLVFKNFSEIIKIKDGLISLGILYQFISPPSIINTKFLGLIELTQPSFVLAVFAGGVQFFQTKVFSFNASKIKEKKNDFSSSLQRQITYFFPFLTILVLWRLPSAIAVYWITTSLLSIIQQYFVFSKGYGTTKQRK